jgi:phosphoribosylformylglycinamidine synthase
MDNLAVKIGRKLTDSEIFGFSSQFRALSSQDFQRKFVIDGVKKNLLYSK